MMKSFTDIFIDKTKDATKLQTSDYQKCGKYLIVDQGQSQIAGYTNRNIGVFTDLPAIIFGDHTRVIKYVNQPFFIGADGVKVLKSILPNTNYKYLYYALKYAKIPNTGYNRHYKWLKEVKIRYPEYIKQREIVEALDRLISIQDLQKETIKHFDNLIKARFVEMFGDPITNPKKWLTKLFLSMGTCKNGMNFHYDDAGVEINCLGVGDFKDHAILTDTSNLPKISLNTMPSWEYLLQDGDIVFVRSNGNKRMVGRSIVVYPGKTPTTFSGFCIRYRLRDRAVVIPYLLRVLKTDSVRQKMYGRGANIQNLNQQTLSSLVIPVPPLKLQIKFATFVSQIDKSKVAVQKSLEQTQLLFDSLMQEYFG